MAGKVISMEAKLAAVFTAGVPVNVSELCCRLEVSRQTFYKYRRRWAAEGPAGLMERTRRPDRSPNQIEGWLEDEIVRLRKELPVDNGADTIRWHLGRRGITAPDRSTIYRALKRRGMITPNPAKRPRSSYRRFVWPQPNSAWQIDGTQWALADYSTVWIMDVIDDHSRVATAARAGPGETTQLAWEATSHGISEWGLPARVISDNGVEFTHRLHTGGTGAFDEHLDDLNIAHICSSPGHPTTCGKVERYHRTTKDWLATQPPAATIAELQNQLDAWRNYYNHQRPHSSLHGPTPAEAFAARGPELPHNTSGQTPQASLHTISSGGHFGWRRWTIGADSRLAGQQVLVIARGLDLDIHGPTGHIRSLTINPNRRYQPTGNPPGRKPTT